VATRKLYRGSEGDSQGGIQPPGASPRDEGTMIDDDFMRIVDQLFSRMMSDMLGISRWDSSGIESDAHIEDSEEQSVEFAKDKDENDGEMIDLGDSILVVVDNMPDTARPRAVIENKVLTIRIKTGHEREIRFELPYSVSVKRSNMSVKNGVMELHLPKLSNDEEEIDSDGIIS